MVENAVDDYCAVLLAIDNWGNMSALKEVWTILVVKSRYLEVGWIVPAIAHSKNTMGTDPHQFYDRASSRQLVWSYYDICRPFL